MSKKIKSAKDARPLLREFFKLEGETKKAEERKAEIKSALLPFMEKKELPHLDYGDRRMLYVDPKITTYDIEAIRKIVKDPKVKKLARKHDIDLDELIQTVEKLNTSVFEDLLKAKIITRKQAKKVITITDGTVYLRPSNVPKSGTK